ncbi:MAG: ABC transporter substrate-binding protein, partial [Gammaproteobacteria bacterium]|nr:ABC transporter substrate-binding protein [Gammaproteobacteria bacterium]
ARRETLLRRLNKDRDIDLVIAMGTWAGKDLATSKHNTPTIVMSSSDPIGSGIIASAEDSGFDHLHARVDPKRYERQVRVFHDVIGFKKLGVAYEDSVVGKSYAAIDVVERVAAERGFEVVHCHTQSDIADEKRAGESVHRCFEMLSRKVDAIYVTVQGGVNSETIPRLVKLANNYRIPTFSQLGSTEVKHGFLLSISRAGGFKPVGRFLAATIAKVFNGARPRDLNQVFEDAPNIAINLKTAELVGLYLYAHVLAAADEIYRDISVPR